ncbi:MAG TPA: TorF family putative porin, partial [Syntrophorhabdales bacterium]|nr:TorF family putative porin [Syntrophorhabdales bacterium]
MKTVAVILLTIFLVVACTTGVLRAQEAKEAPKAAVTEPLTTTAPAAPSGEQKGEAAKPPAEEPVTGTASVSFLNQYMFRGYQLGKDSLIIQPSLSASYKGFTASFWGNIDSHEKATQNFNPDDPGHQSFNETDLTLSYTYVLDKFSF